MSNQLKELNSNIPAKTAEIRQYSKAVKRVRVYFQVQVYKADMSDIAYMSDELTAAKAKKIFDTLTYTPSERAKLLSIRPAQHCIQLVRIQTGGHVGGIILGGSREKVDEVII